MKLNIFKSLAAAGAIMLGATALTGCQDHFDDWDLGAPVAQNKANISIYDFKKIFWQDSENYCVEIPAREDGSHYIVSGRVISSDEQGNVFKNLYIQDETAALTFSINQYNIYATNRIGQEIVVDLTGLHCGRFAGLFQIGAIDFDDKTGDAGTTFMAPEVFNLHREYNGYPEPEKIDTLLITDISSDASDLLKWQGQLVRINNVTFANANNPQDNLLCNEYHSSGYNQSITGDFGSVNLRTSGYSTFWNTKLPTKACDVVGILGYYNNDFQILLNDINGLMNIGDPTAEGIKTKPYTVERAIELSAADNTIGWVKGYIVGTLKPEVTTVSSDNDIQWIGSEPFIMDNYLVIAPTPDVRDYTKCLLVPITAGSALYTYGNLADHPELAGRTLNIRGRFSVSMGMAYLAANDGTAPTFQIEGVDVPGSDEPEVTEGDGSEASPYNVAQGIAHVGETNKWVKGYIVGAMNTSDSSNYVFEVTAPFTVAANVYIADKADETNTTKMMPVQLSAGSATRTAVNLKDHPENFGKVVAVCGSLENYFKQPGLKSPTAYKLDGQGGDTPTPPATGGSGTGTAADPYNVAAAIARNGETDKWVKGIIVGTMNSNNNYTLEVTAPFSVASNVYIADNASETDTKNMLPVQLVAGTAVRTAVNLIDHPENIGKELSVCGALATYFQQTGLKSPTDYKLGSQGGDTPTPPVEVGSGSGTETDPYDVTAAIARTGESGKWVKGYIVGALNSAANYSLEVTAPFTVAANVCIAADANETDPAKMLPVQLPGSSAIRTAVNLVDHADNIGKELSVCGSLATYLQRPGLKSPTDFKL